MIQAARDTIFLAVVLVGFTFILFIGLSKEAIRMETQTQMNCKEYGHAMNNWARQSNKPLPCEE